MDAFYFFKYWYHISPHLLFKLKFLVSSIFIWNEVIFFLLSVNILQLVTFFLPSFVAAVVYASLVEVLLVTSRLGFSAGLAVHIPDLTFEYNDCLAGACRYLFVIDLWFTVTSWSFTAELHSGISSSSFYTDSFCLPMKSFCPYWIDVWQISRLNFPSVFFHFSSGKMFKLWLLHLCY